MNFIKIITTVILKKYDPTHDSSQCTLTGMLFTLIYGVIL